MYKVLTAVVMIACGASAHAEPRLIVTKTGRRLEVRADFDRGFTRIEIRLSSSRNDKISRFTDVSPLDPRPRTAWPVDRETWYPVVDLQLDAGMEGVATFDPAPKTTYTMNGMFHREKKPLAALVTMPLDRLEPWENSLVVESSAARLRSFHIRHALHAASGRVRHVYRVLSDNWSGTVSLHGLDAEGTSRELASARIEGSAQGIETLAGAGALDEERLLQSLAETVEYTLRSQNRDPRSPMHGGLLLFYDLDASLYRTSHWIWGWGPSVKLLLDTAKVRALAVRFGAAKLRRAAGEIGRASLNFDPRKGPADGVPVSRWDRSINYEYGHSKAITPSDANFLAGWAWIPLYEDTGDKRYLEAAEALALATDRLSRQFGLIPQNYWPDQAEWSDFTLDESGFGMEGLAELYRVTRAPRYRELGQRYIQAHLARLQRTDGLWERNWLRSRQVASPTLRNTRAAGWAMEGLLAAHRMNPDGDYLELARRMAEHLLRSQHPEGYWNFSFDQPTEKVGIAAKGTALWALLFYQLYHETGEQRHLQAARKALGWLIANQYAGPDPDARGSVYDRNNNSGVGYRPWFRVSCTYGSAFFGLAVLEELRLQGTGAGSRSR